jgi:hypothetical protein
VFWISKKGFYINAKTPSEIICKILPLRVIRGLLQSHIADHYYYIKKQNPQQNLLEIFSVLVLQHSYCFIQLDGLRPPN